jgi:hypothetical protein
MPASFEIVNARDDALGYIGHLTRGGDRIWAVGGTHAKPTVLTSPDGRTWSVKKPPPANGLRDLVILDHPPNGPLRGPDGKRLITCGEGGTLFVSDDDGESWVDRKTKTTVCLFTLCVDSRGHVWLAGERGFVRRSKDKGETWNNMVIGTDARVNVIASIDATVFFACHDGTLFRYRRDRIEKVKLSSTAPITAFERTAKGTFVMTGDRATILRSEDATTWTSVESPEKVDLEHVREIEPGVLVACGDKGTVLVSHDEAKTFVKVPSTLECHLWCVFPIAGGALIGGDAGLIARMKLGEL